MRIGVASVSTRDKNPLAYRPEVDKTLLSANLAGDQIVVTKLDGLGYATVDGFIS